jgi:hypothetical protein
MRDKLSSYLVAGGSLVSLGGNGLFVRDYQDFRV